MGLGSSIANKIKDVFNQGPDNWRDRLKSTIEFISPEGKTFSAKWRGDDMKFDKRVGTFDIPKVNGTIAQDMGLNSREFNIPFFFDGKDCDILGLAFCDALKERGPWEVTHPSFGFFELQPISVSAKNSLITKGNVFEIASKWIEPIDQDEQKTGRELAGIVDSLSQDLNLSAIEKFVAGVKTGTEAFRNAVDKGVNGVQNVSEFVLSPLTATVDSVNAIFRSTQNAINSTLLATVFEVRQLAGQIQDLIQIPVKSNYNLETRKSTFDRFITETKALKTEEVSEAAKNNLLVTEIALTAAVVSQAQVVITTPVRQIEENEPTVLGFRSRPEILAVIEDLNALVDDVVATLDASQTQYEDEPYEKQYFSMSDTYATLIQLVQATNEYLMSVIFDLPVERRITLDRPRLPIDVTISEYGSLGNNEYFLDLFIESNKLTGDNLVLIPANTEVVIYD